MNEGALEDMLARMGLKATRPGEWRGMCPACGGSTASTKFVFTRSAGRNGLFHCHACGKAGTPEHLYAATDGGQTAWHDPEPKAYRTAMIALGIDGHASRAADDRWDRERISAPKAWTPPPERTPPPAEWQDRRKRALRIWCRHILREPGRECLAALRKRHLTLDEARRLAKAGLLGWADGDAHERGLVCAAWRGDDLVCVRVRREDGWKILPGGQNVPLVLGLAPGKPAVVVEAYIDALVGWAHHGHRAAFIGLGSVSIQPAAELAEALAAAPRLLVAIDADAAGDGRWAWWRDRFPNAGRFRPVDGRKGFGDMDPARAEDVLDAALAIELERIRSWKPRVTIAAQDRHAHEPERLQDLEHEHADAPDLEHGDADGHAEEKPEAMPAPAGTLPLLLQWADTVLARRDAIRDARGVTFAQPVWRIHIPTVYANAPGYHATVTADDVWQHALTAGWMLPREASAWHLSVVLRALWERTGAVAVRAEDGSVNIIPARAHRWGRSREDFRDAPPLTLPDRVDLEAARDALEELAATIAARPADMWQRFPLRRILPAGLHLHRHRKERIQ